MRRKKCTNTRVQPAMPLFRPPGTDVQPVVVSDLWHYWALRRAGHSVTLIPSRSRRLECELGLRQMEKTWNQRCSNQVR
jgi:hypothetical protein